MVDSVLSSGLRGIQSGINSAREAAEDIAQATTSDQFSNAVNPSQSLAAAEQGGGGLESITEAAVQLKVSELQVEASAAVVRTADEVLGTLINTKA